MLLDPRDTRPRARAVLHDCLALQRRFAFEPEHVADALRRGVDPAGLVGAKSVTDLERDAEALARCGARLLRLGTRGYPPRLARLADAPGVLAIRGEAHVLGLRSVAIVGARAPTVYGRSLATRLADGLARAGLLVVSGLARGIDACAHRGALAAGGYTLAFLGHGPERIYPPEHVRLASEIAESGALVSELPVGTPPLAHCFPLRNRLISGLCEAVIVVEARLRSGSLVTARHAAEQGVDVFAVPGPVDAPTSRGTLALLRDGVAPVAEAEDVLRALRPPVEPVAAGPPRAAAAPDDPLEARVLAVLAEAPRSPDDLAAELAIAPERLVRALVELEIAGRVRVDRDGRLRRMA